MTYDVCADEWGIHTFHTDYVHCVFTVIVVCLVLCPFDMFFRATRIFLASNLLKIIIAPFAKVSFVQLFVADQLCSLVKVLLDLNYAVCFYATEGYISHDPAPCQVGSCGRLSVF